MLVTRCAGGRAAGAACHVQRSRKTQSWRKNSKVGHMSNLTVRGGGRGAARGAGGAARRALANRRGAAGFDNFCGKTTQTFTIHRPKNCLNFEFELRKSSPWSPPRCPRQRWHFYLLTRLPRATPRCCTPSNTQNTYYMFVYWHSSFVCAGASCSAWAGSTPSAN